MKRTPEQLEKRRIRERARYQRNKKVWGPALAEKQRLRRAAMTEEQREAERARNREARRKDTPQQRMYFAARSRASKRSVKFEIEMADIVVPEVCPVLGIALQHSRVTGMPNENSPSLDRIVPSLGYVKGNVIVVSYRANRLKNDGTAEEHEAISRFIRSRT